MVWDIFLAYEKTKCCNVRFICLFQYLIKHLNYEINTFDFSLGKNLTKQTIISIYNLFVKIHSFIASQYMLVTVVKVQYNCVVLHALCSVEL